MKSLTELTALRDKLKAEMDENTRIVVGMATCGIAAGARPVFNRFSDEVGSRHLANVSVIQTGCVGVCQFEPVVEVFVPGKDKVTYVNMTADKVARIVADHIVNGNPVSEYTIGAATTSSK